MSNVADTSRAVYHSLDNKAVLETVRGKVAAEIRRLTKAGQGAYIALVAFNLGLEKSTVAGRFNELTYGPNPDRENPVIVPFQVGGKWFRMEPAGKRPMPVPTDPVKFRTVETWAIVDCPPPAPKAEQVKLF